jgi:hypothetical protein
MLKRILIVFIMTMISCTGLDGEALKQVAGAAIGERTAAVQARINEGKGKAGVTRASLRTPIRPSQGRSPVTTGMWGR